MDLDFLKRVGRSTVVLGAVAFLFVAVYYDVTFAAGILIGCLWGVANFAAISAVIRATIRPDGVRRRRALLFAAVKFPVLYGIGYLILRSHRLLPVALVMGFSFLFLVIFLKALGRFYLRLDERVPRVPVPKAADHTASSVPTA